MSTITELEKIEAQLAAAKAAKDADLIRSLIPAVNAARRATAAANPAPVEAPAPAAPARVFYAQFVDSRAVGGWYVADSPDEAQTMAKSSINTIEAELRSRHSLGGCVKVSEKDLAWKLGGGNPASLKHGRIRACSINLQAADVSDSKDWDFTNIIGV